MKFLSSVKYLNQLEILMSSIEESDWTSFEDIKIEKKVLKCIAEIENSK